MEKQDDAANAESQSPGALKRSVSRRSSGHSRSQPNGKRSATVGSDADTALLPRNVERNAAIATIPGPRQEACAICFGSGWIFAPGCDSAGATIDCPGCRLQCYE